MTGIQTIGKGKGALENVASPPQPNEFGGAGGPNPGGLRNPGGPKDPGELPDESESDNSQTSMGSEVFVKNTMLLSISVRSKP